MYKILFLKIDIQNFLVTNNYYVFMSGMMILYFTNIILKCDQDFQNGM
jgi:hypothetical protein